MEQDTNRHRASVHTNTTTFIVSLRSTVLSLGGYPFTSLSGSTLWTGSWIRAVKLQKGIRQTILSP